MILGLIMKIQTWYKSALAATALVTMVGCGSSSSSGSSDPVVDTTGPVFTSPTEVSMDENTVEVTTLEATDASAPVTFNLASSGADTQKFLIDSENRLKFSIAPNHEAPGSSTSSNIYNVNVIATDDVGNESLQSLVVSVLNTNAPGFISDRLVSVGENTRTVTTVAVQGEGNTLPVLSLSGGEDQGLFDFDVDSALLTFKTLPDFEAPADSDLNNIYKVQMTATEGAESTVQEMEITVVDINSTALEISSAVYDETLGSEKLFVYFSTQIDDGSAANPAFAFSDGAAISGTYGYSEGLPYKLTVDGELTGFVADSTKIQVVDGGFEIDGNEAESSELVTISALQVIPAVGSRSFTADAGNGIVEDGDLGLVWQQDEQGEQVWADAVDYCSNLSLFGNADWRLPTIAELASITDKTTAEPAIYVEFDQSLNGHYWSSTDFIADDTRAWTVGTVSGLSDTVDKATGSAWVRCVRGVKSSKVTYINDTATKIVYDTKSGLTWDNSDQTHDVSNLTWQDAADYCTDNTLGSHTWRLPSVSELESIIDYSMEPRPINEVFVGTQHAGYWTSTEDANASTGKAWTVRFSGGASILEDKGLTDETFVRCVTDL